MAGVPVVQILPFPRTKPVPHRDLYHCKYCKELRLAKNIQSSPYERPPMITFAFILSYLPFAWYVITGNEAGLMLWLFLMSLAMVF